VNVNVLHAGATVNDTAAAASASAILSYLPSASATLSYLPTDGERHLPAATLSYLPAEVKDGAVLGEHSWLDGAVLGAGAAGGAAGGGALVGAPYWAPTLQQRGSPTASLSAVLSAAGSPTASGSGTAGGSDSGGKTRWELLLHALQRERGVTCAWVASGGTLGSFGAKLADFRRRTDAAGPAPELLNRLQLQREAVDAEVVRRWSDEFGNSSDFPAPRQISSSDLSAPRQISSSDFPAPVSSPPSMPPAAPAATSMGDRRSRPRSPAATSMGDRSFLASGPGVAGRAQVFYAVLRAYSALCEEVLQLVERQVRDDDL